MKVCVWKTGHEIADRVASAISPAWYNTVDLCDAIINDFDVHVGYGILRGMDAVFRACDKANKPWFNIDKGYFKPGHYDGYYRVSLRGTQQTFGLDKIEPDYGRWAGLGIEILQSAERNGNHTLIIPPTDYVCEWLGINSNNWISQIGHNEYLANHNDYYAHVRHKEDTEPLQNALDRFDRITTFNSSVGWEALRQGIPVVSDAEHSIVGSYQKLVAKDLSKDYEERRRLFAIMASLDLTLEEMKSGKLWPLMQNLLQYT